MFRHDFGGVKEEVNKMKRILMSLLTIALVSTVAIGATKAYFTSDVVLSSNTFSTGTIVLTDTRESWMLPFSITNMKPGDWNRRWVTVKNNGTLDIDFLKVNKSNVVDSSNLLGQIVVSATGRVGSADSAYFTDDWMTLGSKPTASSWFNNSDLLDTAFYRTPAGVIHPGETYTMTFDFTLPTTVGNDFQGKTATFDLTFTGEQSH
jgi:predicted ribosomally synthesized peptide with SipW-like signal peptide